MTDDALFSRLTSEQIPCVSHVNGPLVVSAGAGSGKTLMLTRRIAYALLHPEQSGVTSIDQILTITFTRRAANEIKSRIRQTLLSQGMIEQALKVDASWISTIHGACSRILHENALELGIDPGFRVLDDSQADDLLLASINDALARAGIERPAARPSEDEASGKPDASLASEQYAELFREYEVQAKGSSVVEMLETILSDAANIRDGLSAIEWGPDPLPARTIASDLLARVRMLGDAVQESVRNAAKGKVSAFATKAMAVLYGASANASSATDGNGSARADDLGGGALIDLEKLAASDGATYDQLAQTIARYNFKFGVAPAALRQANDEMRLELSRACLECLAGITLRPRQELLALAKETLRIYAGKKRELRMLDQDDLLALTLDALENNERVREAYENRFALVMVDEFQDTSALQIEIIDKLCGSARRHLCTVGDAEQSIYRFRGADVATYQLHKQQTAAMPDALSQRLTRNFRSHPAIISFVNRVFSQKRVFGSSSEFIELDTPPNRPSNLPGSPEAAVDVVTVTSSGKSRSGNRPVVAAHEICRRFLSLHEKGSSWGTMVILLGKMSNAETYADELRSHGIPCVITAGSVFADAPESQTVCALASTIANPLDDANLLEVLTSDLFGLSPDELLWLATDSQGRQRHFWDGLCASADADASIDDGAAGSSPRIRLARCVLTSAVRDAAGLPPSEVLSNAVVSSGWYDRLVGQGPQGTSVAANVLKAIRMAAELEKDARRPASIASVAARMRADFDHGMKEAPGAINAAGEDAVKIMTIHASKGLEYPIVALADFCDEWTPRSPLVSLLSSSRFMLTLRPSLSVRKDEGKYEAVKKYASEYDKLYQKAKAEEWFEPTCEDAAIEEGAPDRAESAQGFERALLNKAKLEELAESRRKFYVGATRAQEKLIVVLEGSKLSSSTGSSSSSAPRKPRATQNGAGGAESADDLVASAPAPMYSQSLVEDVRCSLGIEAPAESGDFPVDFTRPLPFPRHGGSARDAAGEAGALGDAARPAPAEPAAEGENESEAECMAMRITRIDLDAQSKNEALRVGDELVAIDEYLSDLCDLKETDASQASQAFVVPEPIDIANLVPAPLPATSPRASEFSYSALSTSGKTYSELNRERIIELHKLGADATAYRSAPGASWQADADGIREDAANVDGVDDSLDSENADPTISISAGRQAPTWSMTFGDRSGASDKPKVSPTAFGSAFHAAAQWMVERLLFARTSRRPDISADALELPDDSRLLSISAAWGLDEASLPRLHAALERWVRSDAAREALARPRLYPEVPIYETMPGPQGEPLHLNGTIDLLACDAALPASKQRALVIDYKTGGSQSESAADLEEKHALQARCYAFGLLRQGFSGVDLRFVRVEVPDVNAGVADGSLSSGLADTNGVGQPQVVRYAFEASELDALEAGIRNAYRDAHAASPVQAPGQS
jgi:ATP-dependent helicase/nuclease subunit A